MKKWWFDACNLKYFEVCVLQDLLPDLTQVHDTDMLESCYYSIHTSKLADSKSTALQLARTALNEEYLATQHSIKELQKRCDKIQELIEESSAKAQQDD